jgi:dynein heavy chain
MDDTTKMQLVEGLFLFSMVWTVGATGDGESRAKFNEFFRTASMGAVPDG